MPLELQSRCKVNLMLNVLGRREDGFHELETVMFPLPMYDVLEFEKRGASIALTCDCPDLPVDGTNLVVRAAGLFRDAAGVSEGVHIRLAKKIPLSAGLGGGSGNAAAALLGLNELFGHPLEPAQLEVLAAELGSDVPFFLQDGPALATGRGERIEPLEPFDALRGWHIVLVHPGFGVSTPWAYRSLADFPESLDGGEGRAADLVLRLRKEDVASAAEAFFNSLEGPVHRKYPLLALLKERLREMGATVALMSGSGSTTFALVPEAGAAGELAVRIREEFGGDFWTAVLPL